MPLRWPNNMTISMLPSEFIPHDAKLATQVDFEFLKSLASHPKVVAWGEIGLDFYYGHSARDIQLDVFVHQLELAGEAELPVIIHSRDAESETIEALRRQSQKKALHGVMHCYSGSLEMARELFGIRALDFVLRDDHLPESAEHSRYRTADPARSPVNRNRLALSGPCATQGKEE